MPFSLLGQVVSDSCYESGTKDMTDSIYRLQEVKVVGVYQSKAITGTMDGRLDLRLDALQSLPHLFGTTDIIRTMRLMPGVQTTSEMDAGLYVRGAEPSHNQILLNGAPIYSPMHLLGFFSVFNNSHLQTASLQKSYINPCYGGRAGSVLSIEAEDELLTRPTIEATLGLLSSQGTVACPLGSKSSLYLSARGAYVNPILDLISSSDDGQQIHYGFQDYNLTYVFQPSEQHKFVANLYYGGDKLSVWHNDIQADGNLHWENFAASLRWIALFSQKRKLEQTLFTSCYNNNIVIALNEDKVKINSALKDFGYRGRFSFPLGRSRWEAGVDYVCHLLTPQNFDTSGYYGIDSNTDLQRYITHEAGIYLNTSLPLNNYLALRLGLRYSGLFHTGPFDDTEYDAFGVSIGGRHYGRGNLVKYDGGLEPRLALEYDMNANSRFLFSYVLQRQYQTQLAVSSLSLPIDFWVSSSKNIPSQYAHSLTGGYFCSLAGGDYELSIEAYYKHLLGQLEFTGGLYDMINQQYILKEHLQEGWGYSYGCEWMFKKNLGKFTGWCSYTLGWSKRKFPGINGGKNFPARHDRRHDLSMVGTYHFNDRWGCSATFVYATGSAYTAPLNSYLLGENAVTQYGSHNGARMPSYQRLDLSVNYWIRRTSRCESSLNFSLYNAYARKNPLYVNYSIYLDEEKQNAQIARKSPALYTILPSVSYTFKF